MVCPRAALVLLVLAATATAQCAGYVALAEQRLAPPYPKYFEAGQEYFHAAECYAAIRATPLSLKYYDLAAKHFLQAADFLTAGGDQFQRAKSYELAGVSYAVLGRYDDAVTNFDHAVIEYARNGAFPKEAAAAAETAGDRLAPVDAVTAARFYQDAAARYTAAGLADEAVRVAAKQPAEGRPAQDTASLLNAVGLVSLAALFASIALLGYIFATHWFRGEPGPRRELPPREALPREPPRRLPERPPSTPTPLTPPAEPRLSPKEKLARKIRQRYGLT